jgi:hypothetical protein
MSTHSQKNLVRLAAAVLGIGLVAALLAVSRPGAAGSPLPASVRVSMAPAGELEANPASPRPILLANSLLPGRRPVAAAFSVRNQTGDALAISLRTSADSTALDGMLEVRLSAGPRTLADTTLQGMRLRPVRLKLASGTRAHLRIEASIPADVLSGYEGRLVHIALTPVVSPLGGQR